MKIVYDDIVYSLQKAGGISELWYQISVGASEGTKHIIYDDAVKNIAYEKVDGAIYDIRSSQNIKVKRYLNPIVDEKEPFIFHSSYFRLCNNKKAINVVHIYDFIYERYRTDIKAALHKWQKRRAILKSKAVICISESTKQDLMRFCPQYNGIIRIIHCGYDTDAYQFRNMNKREKKIVYVGARGRYKRFDVVVKLLEQLPDFELVIVGSGNLTDQEIELLNPIADRYTKLGFLSRAELAEVYNNSYLLCYSSDYEGFGIPPIESQACGCPVICQQSSSLIEVVEDTGIVLHPKDIMRTVNDIRNLELQDNYILLQKKGLDNVKRFSWKKCREEVKQLYADLDNK